MSLIESSTPVVSLIERLCGRTAEELKGIAELPWESRQAILEVLEREEEMRLLLEGATELAICMLDPSGFVMHWHKGASKLTQYDSEEVLGEHFGRFFTEMDQCSGLAARALDLARAEGRYDVEHWFVRRNRSGFWASQTIQPVIDPAQQLIGYAVVIKDNTQTWLEHVALTRAKEDAEAAAIKADGLSTELLEANRDLQQANDRLQKFTSIVAHDLRAPLLRVETMVRFLSEDYSAEFDAEGQDIVQRIEAGVGRIRLMLASLLEYSKCSRVAIQGKTAHLAPIMAAVMEDLGIKDSDTDVVLEMGGADEVMGDPLLLGHVLQNLIGNAMKFRHPDRKPRITIQARHTAVGDVEVSVADNGIGVEPRFAAKVFDMFYRLHGEEEYAGTGIGLTVCRKIVNDHDGRIWIDEEYTGGTRVVFTLTPVEQEAITALPASAEVEVRAA